MESTNLHEEEYEHQLQDEVSPCFSVGNHAWRPSNFLLNNNNIHAGCEEERTPSNSLTTNPMIQNMGFSWGNPNVNLIDDQQTLITNNKMLIKQESSSTSSSSNHHLLLLNHHQNSSPNSIFPTEMLSPSSTSPSELLLLNTLSPNYKNPMLGNREVLQLHHQGGENLGVTTNFSQIFPSVNISSLSTSNNSNNNNNENSNITELVSSSRRMEMSHDDLDAFTTARLLNEGNHLITEGIAPNNSHLLELFKHENHHLQQQSSDLKLWNKANPSSFDDNGVAESNRSGCIVEPNSTQNHQMVSKKPRFESCSYCPPFKARKEKLGDRIAALQQLVAPFGKTDTASVLMEAIGYIKFLQNQVETLSVPYMKLSTSRNKLRTSNTQRVSEEGSESGDEQNRDLRSRGLCLVPISCMTYLAGDAYNGGLWPSPSFHPGF